MTSELFSSVLKIMDRDLWMCDPPIHVENGTFISSDVFLMVMEKLTGASQNCNGMFIVHHCSFDYYFFNS
jgi:hypothetical protein